MPGTTEKMLVMTQRMEDGYQPHHPDDVRDDERSAGFTAELSLRYREWLGKKREPKTA